MTPGEVKEIIKAVNINTYWTFLIVFISSGIAAFIGAYLKFKGEHIAKKEDIEEITKKVKNIESIIEDESFKKKFKYEKKCDVYGIIWSALSDMHNATIKLRSLAKADEETKKVRSQFVDSFNTFHISVIKNRPFIDETFYRKCKDMIDVFKGDFFEFHKSLARQAGGADGFAEWIEAEKRLDKIDSEIENIIKYIKEDLDKMN